MSQRLFAAVDLADDARERIAAAVADLRRALADAGMADALRWVAVENMHLTLRFLGNVPDDQAARAREVMQQPFAHAPSAITLGGLGTFPPRGRPRVLHVALSQGGDALSALRDAVDARLAPVCRWEPETRPFAPHLTLARSRDSAKLSPVEFSRLIAGEPWPAVTFTASHVTLFSSQTFASGPKYTAEARAALISG